jgi:hypothetical protein
MPFFNDCLSLHSVRPPTHMKDHLPATYLNRGWLIAFNNLQQVPISPYVVTFPVNVFALGLSLLLPHLALLFLDPRQFSNREDAVSRLMCSGAAMRTRPVGGWTLRWTFLMSFRITSTPMSPSCIRKRISILFEL